MKKKIIINSVLALCIIGLAYSCYMSIWSEIEFDKEKKYREDAVIASLMKIKEAEEEFKKTHGYFCGDIDSLIDWVKNGRAIENIKEEGELTDDQLDSLRKEILPRIESDEELSNEEFFKLAEAEGTRIGLIIRDTSWVNPASFLGINNPDSLKYLPVGKEGSTFQLCTQVKFNMDLGDVIEPEEGDSTAADKAPQKTGDFEILLEVRARLDEYLDGLSAKKIKTLKNELKKRGKNKYELVDNTPDGEEPKESWYGLRIGDVEDEKNRLTGNWE